MDRGPIAETSLGPVEGRDRKHALLFAGIPYAAPPVGRRRFLPPAPHPGWEGTLSARRFGAAAPQHPGTGLTGTNLAWDEDCLTLNVCTPALDGDPRPVLVWIHGGAFRHGKGGIPWYDGSSFATRGDIVTVTINYRLGALGFAHLADFGPEVAGSGNNGLLDQIAALSWVRDHIAAFGGDPARVTIAGESAGAMSVGALLGCPAAKGLFRSAITQSGGAHNTLPAEVARSVAQDLAKELRAERLEDLQARSAEEILDAQDAVAERRWRDVGNLGGMAFQPVVDGLVLPRPPIDAVRDGLAADVTLLNGTNRDESTLFGMGSPNETKLRRKAGRHFADADAALAAYRADLPGASPSELGLAIETDHVFRVPALRLSEAHAESGGRGWHYLFTWRSRAFEGRLGATHALEIPFAFNTLDSPGVDAMLGPGPQPRQLADAVHDAWIAFIRERDPRCDALPAWPAYDTARRPVMELGEEPTLRNDPDRQRRLVWEGVR